MSESAGGRARAAILLALGCIALYLPTLRHGFVFDDVTYITANEPLKGGINRESFAWAFTTSHAGHRHPVTWLSHLLDVELYGLRPAGHHFTSVLLHAMSTVLLFLLLVAASGRRGVSLVAAAFFAVHPLHVESVAWVADRKDLLAGFFSLIIVAAYGRYARATPGRPAAYAVALLAFVLALLSKATAVSLPVVLLVLDGWPLDRLRGGRQIVMRRLAEKIPFLVIAAAVIPASEHAASSQAGSLTPSPWPLGTQAANALVQYVRYLGKTLWPQNLAVLYPYETDPVPLQVMGSALLLAAITVTAVLARRRAPYLLAGWLFFLIMLLPVIGLVPGGPMAMGDRYMYLPLAGLGIMGAWGGAHLVARASHIARVAPSFATAWVIALAVISVVQSRTWHDRESLFAHAYRVNRDNPVTHHNVAALAAEDGRIDEAVAYYRDALAIDPTFVGAHHNLGVLLASEGHLDEAIEHYRAALRLRPDAAETGYALAGALARLDRNEEAVAAYEAVLRVNPAFGEAHNNLGAVLVRMGRLDEAIAHYEEARRLDPSSVIAWENLQDALNRRARVEETRRFGLHTFRGSPSVESP